MDEASSQAPEGDAVTHGICDSCSDTLWSEVGTPLGDFLASLDVPLLIVDGEGRVRRASKETLGLVARERDEVEGVLAGEVFRCVNADLPGGCGHTELCSACTVRNTVTHTYETGEEHLRVPATLDVKEEGGIKEMAFHLTTRKADDRVLVRIEP